MGLEELLEYVYLARDGNGLYIDSNLIEGLLFLDNIRLEKKEFGNINIINREDLSLKDKVLRNHLPSL